MPKKTIDVETHLAAFKKRGLSLAEWYVFCVPGQWPVPKDALPRTAASFSEGDPRGKVDAASCHKAFGTLIQRDLLQIVTKEVLASLKQMVAEAGYGPPVYGLPGLDDVDFTDKGARMFRGLSDELFGRNYFSQAIVDSDGRKVRTVFTAKKQNADAIIAAANAREIRATLSQLGRWCIYWWKVFESGWKVSFPLPAGSALDVPLPA
jgi:hypothetical protein